MHVGCDMCLRRGNEKLKKIMNIASNSYIYIDSIRAPYRLKAQEWLAQVEMSEKNRHLNQQTITLGNQNNDERAVQAHTKEIK